MELSRLAKLLEDCYEQGNAVSPDFGACVAELRRVVAGVAVAVARWSVQAASVEPAAVPGAEQLAALRRLGELLAADDASVGRVLAEVSPKLGHPRLQDDLALLRDLIDDVEYDQAQHVVARMQAALDPSKT